MTITREMSVEETHDSLRRYGKSLDEQETYVYFKCGGASMANFGKGRPGCGYEGIYSYSYSGLGLVSEGDPQGICPRCNGSIYVVKTEHPTVRQNYSFVDLCNMKEVA